MTKKWVFESLVTDDKDAIGLIAYALYKNEKHILASNLRNQGKSEPEIQQEVNTFHDQTLQNNSLTHYRERATTYLSEIIERVQIDEREKYFERERQARKATFIRPKEPENKNPQKYEGVSICKQVFCRKLSAWLLSGIPGIVSSFVLTCFILGASMLLVSEDRRQEVFAE